MKFNLLAVIKRLAFIFLLISGLYYAREFLVPIAIAGLLATLFLPMSVWLVAKGLPKFLAVTACLLVILLFAGGIIAMLSWEISELTTDFALMKLKAIESFNQLQLFLLKHLHLSLNAQTRLFKEEQPSVGSMMQSIGGSFIFMISNLVMILAYIFLLLYYESHIKEFVLRLSNSETRIQMKEMIHKITKVSQQYMVGMGKMIVCLWVMYGIGFSLMGVKNPLFFAFLCGILEIVPYIGNITGTSLTVLMAAAQGASFPLLFGIVIVYVIVQFIQGWVLEPLILGPQVKINPLFTILALILGQTIWGVAGMFMAIPITAIIKIICDEVETLQPYGFLIGELTKGGKKTSVKDLAAGG